jgi:CheY-like chemotaxis protein
MTDVKEAIILMAEDDEDDYLLTKEALQEGRILNKLYRVKDGEKLMDYLLHQGKYTNVADAPEPAIILLDLNMPRKDGREALREIKSNPLLRRIPIIILTTSKSEEDILQSYELGANSYIRKPVSYDRLLEIINKLTEYWLQIVILPPSQ